MYVNQIALILLFRQDPKELGNAFLNMNIDNQNENKIVIQRSSLNPRMVSEKAVKHAYT